LCEDLLGHPAGEFVVKFGAGCRHADGPLYELVAWELARLLGLPVPQAALVNVPLSLRRTASRESIARSIANGHGLNFATAYQRGVRTNPMGHAIPRALYPLAERIFFFDLLIENIDRTVDNPNVLFRRDQLMLIDHESAFVSARRGRDKELRWVDEYYTLLAHHLFRPLLGGRRIDREAVRRSFSNITPTRWREIRDRIPEEWSSEVFNRMESLIFDKLDGLDPFLTDVQGVLS
jgi:hypothetical protein